MPETEQEGLTQLSQDSGKEVLAGIVGDIDQRMLVFPNLEFAFAVWTRGEEMNPNSGVVFARSEAHPAAPDAMRTIATATQSAGSGLELHGLDTPDRVCFYEQEFYVLSNFSAFGIIWRGARFSTVEHAYHFERFYGGFPGDDLVPGRASEDRHRNLIADEVSACLSAHDAFKMAQELKASQRPDWDDVKVGVMQLLLFAKCEQHEYVRRKLLQTGDRLLVENSWRDDFWGWGPNRDGQNMLGRLWMATRKFYRDQETGRDE